MPFFAIPLENIFFFFFKSQMPIITEWLKKSQAPEMETEMCKFGKISGEFWGSCFVQ